MERDVTKDNQTDVLMDSWPLAGDLRDYGGKDLNAKWESLSESDSHADSEKEGLRVSMNGGHHKSDGNRPQKVIVEFICDKDLFGDENLYDPEDKYDGDDGKEKRDETEEPEDGEKEDPAKQPSLKLVKYDKTGVDFDILRLEWKTKFACLDAKDQKDRDPNGHWGFFTWFIIMYVSVFCFKVPRRLLISDSVPSFQLQRTSYSDPGSTTTDMVLEDGIYSHTEIPSAMCLTWPRIGCEEL